MSESNTKMLPKDVEKQSKGKSIISRYKTPITILVVLLLVFVVVITILCGFILSSFIKMPAVAVSNSQPGTTFVLGSEDRIEQPNDDDTQSFNEAKETPKKLAESAEVLQHPMNMTANLGDQLNMNCEFDRPVECAWMRKSSNVEINGRYVYLNSMKGNGNYDCSFSIKSFRLLDAADWQCVGMFSDHSSIVSKTAWLSHSQISSDKEIIARVENISEKNVEEGSDVTLKCEFNRAVECAWMRRGEHVEVRGRYAFTSAANGEEKRKDCSMKVSSVKQIDAGEWVCSNMADSDSVGTVSSPINLIVT